MKINNVLDKLAFLEAIGTVGITSLGDDHASIAIFPKGMALTMIPDYYKKLFGLIMGLQKSLIGPYTFEYLREQGIPGYVVNMRSSDPDTIGENRRFILTTKPTSHVLRTMFFPESIDNAGKAISTLSQIQRLLNLQYHPNLYKIVMELKDYFYFKLCTEDTWYVPLYNVEGWVAAGKPSDGSNFHVRVTSVMSLIAIASKEAEFLQSDLPGLLDLSWTKTVAKDYDPIGEMPKMRLVRLLEAIRLNNQKEIKKIISEVNPIPGNFMSDYNKALMEPVEVIPEEETVLEVEAKKFIFIPHLSSDD